MLQPLDSQDGCFMCVVQVHILDDAHGGRGWLENTSPFEMAVEELPLAPYGDLDRS
jgi:hypothetical protein